MVVVEALYISTLHVLIRLTSDGVGIRVLELLTQHLLILTCTNTILVHRRSSGVITR